MKEKVITSVAVNEDSIIIDWYERTDHPVATGGSMLIPKDFAANNEQLWEDYKELLSDAQVLLESAEAAYHKTDLRMREMGRD